MSFDSMEELVEAAAQTGSPDRKNVQGNVAGFNKDHQRFVFLRFPDKTAAQSFLRAIVDDIATCEKVLSFNGLFKEVHSRRHGSGRRTVQSVWLNLALSPSGLRILEAEGLDTFPAEFTQGMKARAGDLGDVGPSDPGQWIPPFKEEDIHALAIIAADDLEDLAEEYEHLQTHLTECNVQELGEPIDGNARPGGEAGHEHFGFKDGISQPGIAGLTESSKTGTDTIAAGEFICGYPGEGEPPPPPAPSSGGYGPPAPVPPPTLPGWTKDGSFLVFRRLQQNVKGFRESVRAEATKSGMTEELFGAKLVGRYKSGAPLEPVPVEPEGTDLEAADPALANPAVLDDENINAFDYDGDPDGHLTPRAAHIRKANPRSGNPGGKADSNSHRILRRGIPYGPEFVETENPYPETGSVPVEQDRGLLFLCYQSSLARGFEFIQEQWVNQPNFPQAEDGDDPIIAQKSEPRSFSLPRPTETLHLALRQWVRTTGGEYFFAPSIAGLGALAGQPQT
jgi:Dyp-type peroxidase family